MSAVLVTSARPSWLNTPRLALMISRCNAAQQVTSTGVKPLRATEREQAEEISSSPANDEARLETLEALMKTRKAKAAGVQRAAPEPRAQPRPGSAEWVEGELFPEGWENMDPLTKIAELYLGKRGFLFWSSKLALGGCIALAVAWVIFRFVGPSLGLYQLANDMSSPSF